MLDNLRALPPWVKLFIATSYYMLAFVPLVIISVKYQPTDAIPMLPGDYWIWLAFMVVAWIVANLVSHLLGITSGIPRTRASFLNYARSQRVYILASMTFIIISLGGFFDGHLLLLVPALAIVGPGLAGFGIVRLSQQ